MTQPEQPGIRHGCRCVARVAMFLLLVVGAADVHSSALHHNTFRTSTPVLPGCTDVTGHVEPGGAALTPAHEPVLLKGAKGFALDTPRTGSLEPPASTAPTRLAWQNDSPLERGRRPSPARAPPLG